MLTMLARPTLASLAATLVFVALCSPSRAQVETPPTLNRMGKDVRGLAESASDKTPKFTPIPVPISDPTIKHGAALVFLWENPGESPITGANGVINGLAALYTSSDTWMVSGFHEGSYFDDKVDLGASLSGGHFNYEFNGTGNDTLFRDDPVGLSADFAAFQPSAGFDLPAEGWKLTFDYLLLGMDADFGFTGDRELLPVAESDSRTGGLGAKLGWDRRDNAFAPNRGHYLELNAGAYARALGGDFEYQKYGGLFSQWLPLGERLTFSYRLEGTTISGEAPFYDLPSISLRGFPVPRYRDNTMVSAQAELRVALTERVTASVFGGGGRIADDPRGIGSAEDRTAWGGGMRYKIFKDKPVNVGFDLARGDGEWQFYFQIGDWLAW